MHPNGQLVGGRYELSALIATGGMGQVWSARDTVLGREVAVKVLRSEFTGDPTFLARFRAEAQLAAGLVHPNIAALFDYGEVLPTGPQEEHLAFLVMELVRGESLSALLRREHRLDTARALDVLRQSAAGLAAAHAAGVVHRDVKPGNLLLAADGTVKITDFGIAVSTASVPLTQTGQVIGTPHYLSPEQAEGARATPASDVYALGMVGYECLAGHRAFDAESSVQIALMHIRNTPPPLPDDVPPAVRALIGAALAKDPAERFPDGAAFRDAVDDVRAGRPLPQTLPYARTSDVHQLGGLTFPTVAELAEEDTRWTGAWRRRLLVPLVLLLALAAISAGVVQTLAGSGSSPVAAVEPAVASSTEAPASPTVQLVDLTSSAYTGRPVGDVQAELTARGLLVTLAPLITADVPDGQVIAVDPAGPVPPGATVTVTYAVAPAPVDAYTTVVDTSRNGTAVDPAGGTATDAGTAAVTGTERGDTSVTGHGKEKAAGGPAKGKDKGKDKGKG